MITDDHPTSGRARCSVFVVAFFGIIVLVVVTTLALQSPAFFSSEPDAAVDPTFALPSLDFIRTDFIRTDFIRTPDVGKEETFVLRDCRPHPTPPLLSRIASTVRSAVESILYHDYTLCAIVRVDANKENSDGTDNGDDASPYFLAPTVKSLLLNAPTSLTDVIFVGSSPTPERRKLELERFIASTLRCDAWGYRRPQRFSVLVQSNEKGNLHHQTRNHDRDLLSSAIDFILSKLIRHRNKQCTHFLVVDPPHYVSNNFFYYVAPELRQRNKKMISVMTVVENTQSRETNASVNHDDDNGRGFLRGVVFHSSMRKYLRSYSSSLREHVGVNDEHEDDHENVEEAERDFETYFLKQLDRVVAEKDKAVIRRVLVF